MDGEIGNDKMILMSLSSSIRWIEKARGDQWGSLTRLYIII